VIFVVVLIAGEIKISFLQPSGSLDMGGKAVRGFSVPEEQQL